MDPEPSSFIFISLDTLDTTTVVKFIILFILLVFSALISGAEVALFSLSQTDINEEEASDTVRGNIIVNLLRKPKKLLATILVANNTINIAIVLLFTSLGDYLFGSVGNENLQFWLEVILITFLILLFGEILPKVYANRNKVKFSHFMAYPLKVLDVIFTPLSMPMRSITVFLHEKLGRQKANLSVDQLSQALELTSEDDTTKEEQKILKGIVSFGNTDTKQVMCPRIDVFAINETQKFLEIMPEIIKHGFSRIPVYKENIDTVTGILYVKDLLPHFDKKSFDWIKLIRTPYFVPENKKLDDLLKEFQEKKIHLAIVVDEYGGTSGVITLEDIIEEIVGDISDEFDDEDLIYSKLDDNNFVFEGKTSLKDFYRVMRIEDESLFEQQKGESETIAGFVLEIAGSFPKKSDKIIFENYTFTVEAMDRRRIKRIKVSLVL